MNKTKIPFSIAFVCLLGLTNISAQTQNQPQQADTSYEVVLHILSASNNSAGKSSVPQSLSNIVKKLKNDFSFSNYNLDSTYLQRTAGSIDFSAISNEPGANQENFTIFSNWSLLGLKSFPNAQGRNLIQFQSLRFGQRVPVKSSAGVVNYEQVGITIQKFSVPEYVPTVVGSLSTSKSDELIFLILTVKPT